MEKRHCSKHGEYFAKKVMMNEITQKYIYTNCPECHEDSKNKLPTEARAMKIQTNFQKSDLPARYLNKIWLSDFVAKTPSAARIKEIMTGYIINFKKLKKQGTSIVFLGIEGTGKTLLACAVANNLLEQSITVRYTTMPTLFTEIECSRKWSAIETQALIINKNVDTGLLILDEVGKQTGSAFEKTKLFEIIDKRYQNESPTIMIANLKQQDFFNLVGGSIVDRLKQGGGIIYNFDWDSHRA